MKELLKRQHADNWEEGYWVLSADSTRSITIVALTSVMHA